MLAHEKPSLRVKKSSRSEGQKYFPILITAFRGVFSLRHTHIRRTNRPLSGITNKVSIKIKFNNNAKAIQ